MQSSSSESSYSYYSEGSWISNFCHLRENSYMCAVDDEWIRDAFNLYGLDNDCRLYKPAINLILGYEESSSDSSDEDYDEDELNEAATYLYGMIHARYIITMDGMEQMEYKYNDNHFGCCSRVYCNAKPLLPVGLSDKPNVDCVKLFCPCCKEIYNPPPEFQNLDGAFFGTTFAHMFLLQYPKYLSSPSQQYEPTVFGYKLHKSSPYYTESEKRKQKNQVVNSV